MKKELTPLELMHQLQRCDRGEIQEIWDKHNLAKGFPKIISGNTQSIGRYPMRKFSKIANKLFFRFMNLWLCAETVKACYGKTDHIRNTQTTKLNHDDAIAYLTDCFALDDYRPTQK